MALRLDQSLPGDTPQPWWLTRPGRVGLATLVLMAIGYALHLARPLLFPIVLAFLLAIVLAPLVRVLRGWRIRSAIAAAIVVGAFAGVMGLAVSMLADPATTWIERAPDTVREIERKLRSVKASIVEAREAAEKVEQIASVDDGAPPQTEVTVKEPSLAARVVDITQEVAFQGLEALFLLYFLLAYGESFLRRLVMLPDRLRAKVRVVKITTEIEQEISTFLLTISCINAGLGAATAIVAAILGLPNPALWGVLAAVLNFIPYLGSAVTLTVLTLVSVLTFDTLPRALLVPALFLGLATIEGQFITPIIVGRRMAFSPLVIAVALMVGAAIWGVVGLLIAVPVLAIVRIVCAHDDELAPIAALLGRD